MVLHGLYCWLWPRAGWNRVDPARVAADCRELGIEGVIPHDGFTAAKWIRTPADAAGKFNDRSKVFTAEGLKLAVGIGRAHGLDDQPKEACAAAIVEALELPGAYPVMLDWEGAYDRPGGREKASWIADHVVEAHEDAPTRIVDCPWWAALYRLRAGGTKGWTHPSAPYVEFGRLCTSDRYVQAYGSADGESLQMLAWSRDPSQYLAIAKKARVTPWTIRGAFTSYHRSWLDVATTTLAEPNSILWSYLEMDAECRKGLLVAKALRARGYAGPDAVTRFAAESGTALSTIPAALGVR